jgi:uncharacterized membrane protein
MTSDRRQIIREEIERWEAEGLLEAETASRLLDLYADDTAGDAGRAGFPYALAFGGILLGAGITVFLVSYLHLRGAALGWSAGVSAALLAATGLSMIHGRERARPDTGRALIVAGSILVWTAIDAWHLADLQHCAIVVAVLGALSHASGSVLTLVQAQCAAISLVFLLIRELLDPEVPGPFCLAIAVFGLANQGVGRLLEALGGPLQVRLASCHVVAGALSVQWGLFILARGGWSDRGEWEERLVWSSLMIGYCLLALRAGLALRRRDLKVLGSFGLGSEALALYSEYLWGSFPKSVTFTLVGLGLIAIGSGWEQRRREKREARDEDRKPAEQKDIERTG